MWTMQSKGSRVLSENSTKFTRVPSKDNIIQRVTKYSIIYTCIKRKPGNSKQLRFPIFFKKSVVILEDLIVSFTVSDNAIPE